MGYDFYTGLKFEYYGFSYFDSVARRHLQFPLLHGDQGFELYTAHLGSGRVAPSLISTNPGLTVNRTHELPW